MYFIIRLNISNIDNIIFNHFESMIIEVTYVQSFVHDSLTVTNNEETGFQYFLTIITDHG